MTVKGAAAGRREERRLEKLERAAAKRRQVEDDIQRRKMGRRIIGDMKMEGHYEDASFLQMLASLIPFILAWYCYNLWLHDLPLAIACVAAVLLFGVLRALVEHGALRRDPPPTAAAAATTAARRRRAAATTPPRRAPLWRRRVPSQLLQPRSPWSARKVPPLPPPPPPLLPP